MADWKNTIRAWLKEPPVDLGDIAAMAGVASIGYGAWLIYPPAAFITVGIIFLIGAILHAR